MVTDTKKRILVTGSSGFIGDSICNEFLNLGFDVIGLDLIRKKSNYKFVNCSILVSEDLQRIFNNYKPDLVIHCAGPTSNLFRDNFKEAINLQIEGTINVVHACKTASVKKYVFISSDHVYMGLNSEIHVDEKTPLGINFNDPKDFTRNLFASTKWISESISLNEIDNSLIFRLASIYGSGRCSNLIKGMIGEAKIKHKIEIWGDGNRSVQFTHVSDVSKIISRSLELPSGIYNISNIKKVKVLDAARIISKYFGASIELVKGKKEGPTFPYVSSVKLLEALKNFNYITLDEGIDLVIGEIND